MHWICYLCGPCILRLVLGNTDQKWVRNSVALWFHSNIWNPFRQQWQCKEKIQCAITAVFNNMRTLKFKTEQTIGLFAAVNHLSGPLGNQKFILTSWKDHGLWLVDFVLFYGGFGVLDGSLLVTVILIECSEKRHWEVEVKLQCSRVGEKRSKKQLCKKFAIFTLPIIHLVYSSLFFLSLVFAFCWVECNTQETLKTILMPTFFLWGWARGYSRCFMGNAKEANCRKSL